MKFDEILDKSTQSDKDNLTIQALKRQEYNRQYQARLRNRAKLLTLEKKVDDNLDFVIGYIKRKYDKKYQSYIEPLPVTEKVDTVDQSFTNWITLSASDYATIEQAYDYSSLSDRVNFKDFKRWFLKHYQQDNSGKFIKS